MKPAAATILPTRWDAVLAVCKDCGKRSRHPKHLKPAGVASELKRGLKRVRSARVLRTGCLGICPKGAIAVAVVDPPAAPRVWLMSQPGQPDELVQQLAATAATAAVADR